MDAGDGAALLHDGVRAAALLAHLTARVGHGLHAIALEAHEASGAALRHEYGAAAAAREGERAERERREKRAQDAAGHRANSSSQAAWCQRGDEDRLASSKPG